MEQKLKKSSQREIIAERNGNRAPHVLFVRETPNSELYGWMPDDRNEPGYGESEELKNH